MENYKIKQIGAAGHVYYFNFKDQFHRLDGPAVEYATGGKFWYVNGQYHRLNGPAYEGINAVTWWIKDKIYFKAEHNRLVLFSILEPQRIRLNPAEG